MALAEMKLQDYRGRGKKLRIDTMWQGQCPPEDHKKKTLVKVWPQLHLRLTILETPGS